MADSLRIERHEGVGRITLMQLGGGDYGQAVLQYDSKTGEEIIAERIPLTLETALWLQHTALPAMIDALRKRRGSNSDP